MSYNMKEKKKVLLTGAAGRVGTFLRQQLADKHFLSGIDRVPVEDEGFDSLVADLTDFDAILPAFEGVDTVVHLAAEPRHTPDISWDVLLPDNIVATANVFEAARRAGVSRVVFFSSMHVSGSHERYQPWRSVAEGDYRDLQPSDIPLISARIPPRPDGLYAVSKVFGEALGSHYFEQHGMSVLCIRLGTMSEDDRPGSDARSFVSWLSARDLAALVDRSIRVPGIAYEIIFAASDNTWKIYDTPRGWRMLGYTPEDNAESFREEAQE